MSIASIGVGGGLAIAGGLGLGGSIFQGISAQNAASDQEQAEQNAINVQQQEFNTQQSELAPYLQAGQAALPQLSSMASQTPTFTQQDFLNNMDPAYQWDIGQGEQAIQRSAAAAGDLQSGNTLQSLNNYAQNQASNEYQNAYNRFMQSQNTQFSRLATLAGYGQGATAQSGQAGANMANNVGSSMVGIGNAQAAGTIGTANAVSSGLSTLGQLPMQGAGLSYLSNMNSYLSGLGGAGGGLGYASSLQMPQLGASLGYGSSSPVSLLSGS